MQNLKSCLHNIIYSLYEKIGDYINRKRLKFGTYFSPAVKKCEVSVEVKNKDVISYKYNIKVDGVNLIVCT